LINLLRAIFKESRSKKLQCLLPKEKCVQSILGDGVKVEKECQHGAGPDSRPAVSKILGRLLRIDLAGGHQLRKAGESQQRFKAYQKN
jgi:hypothetical protein